MRKIVLTIAGSDPSGGAGIQADLRVFDRLGVAGVSAITAITAQTPKRFLSLYPVPSDVLTQQLSAVSEDVRIDGLKIGMVATAANVQAIVWFLKRQKGIPVVVDPVFDASAGFPLIEPDAIPLFEQQLLPLATVVTPNLREASTLAKMRVADITTMQSAAKAIYEDILKMRGGTNKDITVIVKGGHLRELSGRATDVFYNGAEYIDIDGPVIGTGMHGTGCTYSSALAAYLVMGNGVIDAARMAKRFVSEEILRRP